MYCTNCGIRLPDDANFCYKCGISQKGSTQRELTWEVCQIRHTMEEVKRKKSLSKSLAIELGFKSSLDDVTYTNRYVVEAIGPGGLYTVYESEPFETIYCYDVKNEAASTKANEAASKKAFDALVKILFADGWEITEQGKHYSEIKFRRLIKGSS